MCEEIPTAAELHSVSEQTAFRSTEPVLRSGKREALLQMQGNHSSSGTYYATLMIQKARY
jgi:hypothetical protein